jgi:putative spermidine/putrescine transport system permease protein
MSMVTASDRSVRRPTSLSVTGLILVVVLGIFFLNLAALILGVVLNSFATSWFDTLVPDGLTTRWYEYAADLFQLWDVLRVTFIVGGAVVILSLLIGAPAAYALARRQFPGKRALMLLFLLPMLVAPITYGIPLATALYQFDLAGTLVGVILANLVPSIPFVILLLTPFIEQIDENLERAARMCGASTGRIFVKVLIPLMAPGLLAAGLLVLIRVLAMFELTFLTAGPGEQTLVVALYYTVFAAGIRPSQAIDAMAVIYMLTAFIPLVIALRFVNPTQIVARIKQENV